MNIEAPANIEVEQALLGACLVNNKAMDIEAVSKLRDDQFSEPLHGRIWSVLKAVRSEGRVANTITVKDRLPVTVRVGDLTIAQYLARLAGEAVTIINAPDYAATIADVADRRATFAAGEELTLSSANGEAPLNDGIRAAMDRLSNILSEAEARTNKRRAQVIASEAIQNAISSAEKARENGTGITGIPWGLVDLDRFTGGIQPRELTLIGARPSMGKTTLAVSCLRTAAAAGFGGIMYSMETDGEKIGARMLSDLIYSKGVNLPYEDITRGNVDDEQIDAMVRAQAEMTSLPFLVDDRPGLSLADIRISTERTRDRFARDGQQLDFILIDHLGLMKASDHYRGSRTNEIGELTGGLKGLARQLDVSIILLSQLSRQVESRDDKRPMLSDLRDSGSIEQDADFIAFLYRDEYYLTRAKPKDQDAEIELEDKLKTARNKLEFIVAKNRNGRTGTVELFASMAHAAVRNGARQWQ